MSESAERDRIKDLVQGQGQVEVQGSVNYNNAASFSYLAHDGSYLITVTNGIVDITGDPVNAETSSKEVKIEIKSDAKPEIKFEDKLDTKSEVKSQIKSDAKLEVQSETKPEVKSEIKTEIKTDVKDDNKEDDSSTVKTPRMGGRNIAK